MGGDFVFDFEEVFERLVLFFTFKLGRVVFVVVFFRNFIWFF